jgi:hypothetical protein
MKAAVQGAACGLMLGLVVLIGGRLWQPQVAAAQGWQVVRATRFEAVDAAGKVRALLSVPPDRSPSLELFDAAGKARASLSLDPEDRPGVMLLDAAGKVIWKAP